MHHLLIKSLPLVSAASIASFVAYNKNNKDHQAIADSQIITDSQYCAQIETPEKYLKPMFEFNKKTGAPISNIEPELKQRILSSEAIIKRLSKNEQTIHTNNNNVLSLIQTNQYNANNPIEDTFDIRLQPNTKNVQGMLFGVYDGHSGTDCSAFCRDELLDFIEYEASLSTTSDDEKNNENNDELYNLSPSAVNEFEYFKKHNLLPFTRAFLLADTAFLYSCGNGTDKDMKKANTGSCGIVSHIDQIRNKRTNRMDKWVTTSWIGDCRAIIGSKQGNEWKCVELTCDHQINLNPKERLRLLSEHPNESDIIKRNRVKGRLQPTRVFGDGHYKYMKFFNLWKNKLKYLNSAWTPPYVTAKPDISCYRLEENDYFMILSTDGLFQDLHNQQIVEYVGAIIDGKENDFGCENISTLLIRKALLAAGRYFDGNLGNENLNVSSILNLHDRMKRSVHDDLTVITMFFDKTKDDVIIDENDGNKNKGMDAKMPKTLKQLFMQNSTSKL